MGGTAGDVPLALDALANAKDQSSADAAYWRMDNRFVVQGQLFPAAIAAIPVLLAMVAGQLPYWPQLRSLDLLLQIAAGTTDISERQYGRDLGVDARIALRDAVWIFYGLALDADERLAEVALELATTVDGNESRCRTMLSALAESTATVRGFAANLLREVGGT